MKKLTNLIITSLIIFGAQASSAATLSFDDIPEVLALNASGKTLGKMEPYTYQGFNFSSTLYWVDVADLPGDPVNTPHDYGAKSGGFALSNQESGTGVIIEASTFDFTFGGLWAKQWNTPPESGGAYTLTGILEGYKDGELVWEVLPNTALNGSYKLFGPQTGLIDELRLGFGTNFLVDDIELNAVPVPAAVWLFGSGLLGLIAVARRKTQA